MQQKPGTSSLSSGRWTWFVVRVKTLEGFQAGLFSTASEGRRMGVIQEASAGWPAPPLLAVLDLSPRPGKRVQSWGEFLESRGVDRASLRKAEVLTSY